MDKPSSYFLKKPINLIIIWGLILEFPIRYFVSPDPWIHDSGHWYFAQPVRLLIELGFLVLAILPFFWVKELKSLLSLKWSKDDILYLVIGVIITVLIFTSQQWDEIAAIHTKNLNQYIPIWFATGIAIGIGQELTFRGLIYTGFQEKYGQKLAVIVSTLLFAFGSIHSARMYVYLINDYIFETLLLLLIFVFTGLLFVWLRVKTNNILIPSLIHGVGNAITWYSFVIIKLYVN